MATYVYKAKANSGELITGSMEAENQAKLLETLRDRGLYTMEVTEKTMNHRGLAMLFRPRVTLKELAVFCKQFETMVVSGISIMEALLLIKDQTKNMLLADILNEMYAELQKGKMLSETMAKYPEVFSNLFVSMIAMGEASGTLDQVLESLSLYLEKESTISAKIKNAMIYPAVVGSIALLVVIFLMLFVVPRFIKMFARLKTQLPLPTRMLIGITDILKDVKLMVPAILILIVLIYGLKKWLATSRGKALKDKFDLKLPVIGDYVFKMAAYRLSKSLGELLRAGVALVKALEISANVMDNTVISAMIMQVREQVSLGENLADAIASQARFPAMVTQMIRVGEKSGTLDDMMIKIAVYYDEELDNTINRLLFLVEPALLMVVALIVGFIVISMVMPIFSIYSNIG